MLKREKEVFGYLLDTEEAVMKELEKQYRKALDDINTCIRLMQADELTQSRVYRIQYQKTLKKQVEAILEKLHSDEYTSMQQYLSGTYTDAYVGTVYALHGQSVPVIMPIDQKAAVKAVMTDSQISTDLYTHLGVDITKLKKAIPREITRGIASGMLFEEIARNVAFTTGTPLNRAKNIVQTEGHRIQQASAQDARHHAISRGADLVKQWDSTLDGATRDTHRKLDGQIREVDEPFEMDGKKAQHPGDFGDPAEDCRCRCAALSRARKALDADELATMKERANFFDLDKTKDFEDFKKKYLKAAENSTKKAHTVEDVNRKATDALLKAYDDRRVKFGLNTAPAEEMKKLAFNPFTADYSGLSVQTADAFNDTITELSSEYYTGFTRIEVADPKKVFGTHVFASTTHNTAVGQSTLVINPLKTKDYDKMIERVEELSKKGYAVELASGKAGEYIATHEFAHSLFDMKSPLKNYVGMNVKPIQQARKEIDSIYSRYTKEVKELEKTYKGLESKFLLVDDLDEMTSLQSEIIEAKSNLKSVRVSQYSMESSDEFLAEAFTQAKIGSTQSPYTAEVMAVIDKLFKK